jgi:DNA polymerase I-like protein with 3'-5' exonuclease and polymerase domains
MVIGERDAAQLEFRVAVGLGQDEVGERDIRHGFDVHSYSASIIFRGEWEDRDRTPHLRQRSKEHTFKPLYGGTSGTEAEQTYYKAFRERYEGVSTTQDGWVEQALSRGYTDNVTGLKWYWPKVKVTESGYVEGNTNVRNYPIQYLATGEIIPIGVTYVWHMMKAIGLRSLLVNTVHDSMITEEYPEETETLDDITKEAFGTHVPNYMKQVYDFSFNIPLDVDSEQGSHWGEH